MSSTGAAPVIFVGAMLVHGFDVGESVNSHAEDSMKIESDRVWVAAETIGRSTPNEFTRIALWFNAKICTDSSWWFFVDPGQIENTSSHGIDIVADVKAPHSHKKISDISESIREQIASLAGLVFARDTVVTACNSTSWNRADGSVRMCSSFTVDHGNRSSKKTREFINASQALVKANQEAMRDAMAESLTLRDEAIRAAEVEAMVGRVLRTVLRLEREKAEEIVGYKARKVAAAEAYAREIEALDKLVEEQIVAGRPFRIDETLSYAYENMVGRIGADGVKRVRELALASTVTVPTLMGEDKIPIPIVFDIG